MVRWKGGVKRTMYHVMTHLGLKHPPRKGQAGPTGAYLSERLISVVRKTQLVFPIPHRDFLEDGGIDTPDRSAVVRNLCVTAGLLSSEVVGHSRVKPIRTRGIRCDV
jgi:hypothetical protein